MCEELKEKRDEGKRLARQLAEHLRTMRAAWAEIPIFIDDEEYRITVEHVPVEQIDDAAEMPSDA
jgi:hypothetical protein